ncbi:MAG: Tir chaperone protein (CesT) family [Pseudomonadota bacterium]|jgi:hypothetical protein
MSQRIFDGLLECLAGRMGLDPAPLVAARMLEVEGVAFRFDWHALDGEDVFVALCHFGPLQAHADRQAQLARLLEVNLFLVDSDIVTFFAIDRSTGDVMLCLRAPLASLGADTCESAVIGAAAQAQAWRSGHYAMEPRLA